MENVLQTEELTKTYKGVHVVDHVSLTVKQGDIYGFVGKNGAGKTTFIRMVLGLTKPSGGSYRFFDGADISFSRRRTGSLVEAPALYRNMSAKDNLEMYCAMLKVDKGCVPEILKTVGLSNTGKKKTADFSLGMKQRLGLAMALVGDPDFLILDEPINGLDPTGIMEIRELLLSLSRKGKTIFISSHILGELEKVATRYGIISSGKLIEEITALQLRQICVSRTLIRTDQPEKARSVAQRVLQTDQVSVENGVVVISSSVENIGELTSEMFASGIVVSGISNDENSAESYFIRRMEEGS